MNETWLDIPGHPGYQASDRGRVRSLDRFVKRKNGGKAAIKGRVLKPSVGQNGYPMVAIWFDGKAATKTVHSLVLRAFRGDPKAGQECRHLDGDRTNAALANLRWGTRSENMADKLLHGTSPRGESCGTSKLTVDDVREIRRRLAEGETGRSLAKHYGVHDVTISNIKHGDRWGWLE